MCTPSNASTLGVSGSTKRSAMLFSKRSHLGARGDNPRCATTTILSLCRVVAVASVSERARYEAERAERQYKAVYPENRLVARGLEKEWKHGCRTLRRRRLNCSVANNNAHAH